MISKAIALTAYVIVLKKLLHESSNEHKCFRIKNFTEAEALEFVKLWKKLQRPKELEKVSLIVAENIHNQIESEFLAKPQKSITFYRNNNRTGLVYIETRVQSDEQGLQNIFTLQDSNFLDGSFDLHSDTDTFVVAEELFNNCWYVLGKTGSPPNLLKSKTLQVLSYLNDISVRKFTKFILKVLNTYVSINQAQSESQINFLVGNDLIALDCFPDEFFYEDEKKSNKRLVLNRNYSELDSGTGEIDADLLLIKVSGFNFKNYSGQLFDFETNEIYRELCTKFISTVSNDARSKIPFYIFEQLFSVDTSGLLLGDRVLSEITEAEISRVTELLDANIVDGLNKRLEDEALRFLELEPFGDLEPLVQLLNRPTRKLIEQLANPRAQQFFNPILEFVEVVDLLKEGTVEGQSYVLHLKLANKANKNNLAIRLFAFIFGDTLRSAENKSVSDSFSIGLKIDGDLISSIKVPEYKDDDIFEPEDSDNLPFVWEPIPLVFELIDSTGVVINSIRKKEWFPSSDNLDYFAFLWLLVCAPESNYSNIYSGLNLPEEKLLNGTLSDFSNRIIPMSLITPDATYKESSFINDITTIRTSFFSKLKSTGFNHELIDQYIDEWMPLFEDSRTAFIPDGAKIPTIVQLMDLDFINFGVSNKLMLPTHPIRLRWIARYLNECEKLVEVVLSGEKELSKRNPSFYLDWLRNLTPNQAPAICSNKSGEILFSSGEQAWYEEFSPRNNEIAGVTLDAHSTKRIARQITSYLEAHPYKKDGLSLLLVAPYSNKFPSELVNTFRSLDWKDVKVDLTVISKRSTWSEISKFFDGLHGDDHLASGDRLFPSCDLSLVDYGENFSLDEAILGAKFDLAIVTHLLNEKVTVQNYSESPISFGGVFRPLLDRPTNLKGGVSGGAISILMRPSKPDVMLETWSTHVVRSQRLRPIATAQPENTDFLELRVNFEDSAKLFTDLHNSCHWVITLERHISRQQIEALEISPDILSVEEGVGSANNFTLIVSASSGKELIISRLARKLDRLIFDKASLTTCNTSIDTISKIIYNETRRFAPKLALKAMGISRVTEEVIGLMVARSLSNLENVRNKFTDKYLYASISLDEHQNWFGGSTEVRADIANFLFSVIGDDLVLDIEVIEGKLRQQYERHGVLQVSETVKFLQDILLNINRIDSALWREQIISSMETADRNMIHSSGFESDRNLNGLPLLIRDKFSEGSFKVGQIKGIYSICVWDEINKKMSKEMVGDVEVIKTYSTDIIPLILSKINFNEVIQPLFIDSTQDNVALETNKTVNDPITKSSDKIKSEMEPQPNPVITSTATKTHKNKLSTDQLRDMYQVILDCYAEQGIQVSPALVADTPFIEGPASILFKVIPKGPTDPKKLMDKSQVLKLKLRLEQEQEIMFVIAKGYVNIDVPKLPTQRYFVDAGEMWRHWERSDSILEAPLGEDRYGKTVTINFSDTLSPHLLVGGTTGSGKSEALNVLLFGLVRFYSPDELRLLLVDPKGTELQDFARTPHLLGEVGWDDVEALNLLKQAVAEMQTRYEKMRDMRCRTLVEFNSKVTSEKRIPWWVVVLDEYADLTSDSATKKEIEAELKRLAQKARAAGIHVVIATQKPSVEVISTVLRSNLPAQLALRVKSATESRVIMDEPGAEMLNGKGDSYLKLGSATTRIQCALVSKNDTEEILKKFTQ
jgi:S-DNA-T family DNA segregation ATPase FtsK/SpoIIIE